MFAQMSRGSHVVFLGRGWSDVTAFRRVEADFGPRHNWGVWYDPASGWAVVVVR